MPTNEVKYELEKLIVSSAATGYQLAVERGVSGITPELAIEVSLKLRKTGIYRETDLFESLSSTEEGQRYIKYLGEVVASQVAQASPVDPN